MIKMIVVVFLLGLILNYWSKDEILKCIFLEIALFGVLIEHHINRIIEVIVK